MRTKLFTILMALMLFPGFAYALDYAQVTSDIASFNSNVWRDVANCNAQLMVDDVVVADDNAAARYVVLAYVNGTLRGYQDTPTKFRPATGGPASYIYMTSIWANADSETGKTITFYVLDKTTQKVYQATHTHTWAEGTLEMPSSGGMITISTKVPVTSVEATDAEVFATPVSSLASDLFTGSNYPAMFDWVVEMDPYYTVLPEDATNKDVTMDWDYTNTNYACEKGTDGKWYMFVSQGGNYTATIITLDGTRLSANLTLTVKIPVTEIVPNNPMTYWRQDLISDSGLPLMNLYTVQPDVATDPSVTYVLVSAKTTCAGRIMTNARGTVVFMPADNGKGEVYIKVTSVSNPTVSAEVHFTVDVKVTDLTLTNTSRTIVVGEQLTIADLYSITPADAVATVTATPADTDIVSVADGKLTGVAPGTTTVTLSVPTGEMDVTGAPITIDKTMTITVVQPVTSITLNPKFTADDYVVWRKKAIADPVAISQNYYYFVNPDNATNKNVTMEFVSGYEAMGTLTEAMAFSGYYFKPAADKKGEVKIKIASAENPSIYTILTLTVKVEVESITVDPSAMTVAVDSETELTPMITVLPADADNKEVEFSVDDGTLGSVDASGNFKALAAGTATVTVASVQSPNTTATIVFTIKEKCADVTINVTDDANFDAADGSHRLALGEGRTISITATPNGCYFDDSNIDVSYTVTGTLPAGWTGATVAFDGADCTFTPNVPGEYTLNVTYTNPDGSIVTKTTTLNAYPAVDLASGWSWISSNAVTNVSTIVSEFGSSVVEARTKGIYLINDPTWGFITDNGDNDINLKASVDNGHFRIKTDKAVKSLIEGTYDNQGGQWSVVNGWNWVNNPIYYAVDLTKLDGLTGFTEGDVLKGKDGALATYTSGKWVGTLTKLVEGKAYALQSKTTSNVTINFAGVSFDQAFAASSTSPMAAPRRTAGVEGWQYDGGQFMSNMGIIAEMPQITDPENFSIGTFVNGECRGEGRYVDGRWFIFAHGQTGDQVTFKVINHYTGAITELNEVAEFTELAGTYNEPYALTANDFETSGITDAINVGMIYADGQKICGTDVEIYDIKGRNMTAANGNLLSGLYIVKSNGLTYKVTIK